MSRPRIHRDAGADLEDRGSHRTACGRPFMPADRVTEDIGAVTCKGCLRLAAEAGAPPAPFVPSGPYTPPKGQSVLDALAAASVRRSIDGEGADRGTYRSLDDALRAWFERRLRSRVRAAPVVEGAPDKGDGVKVPSSDRALVESHASVRHVESAICSACATPIVFAGGASGVGALSVPGTVARRVIILYLEGKSEPARIAERVAEWLGVSDDRVTAHQVGLVWRELRRRATAWLDARGLLARSIEGGQSGGEEAGRGETRMATLPGYELEGVKVIAAHVGCSETTVKRAIARGAGENPLPVVRYLGGVYASKSEVDAWQRREAKGNAA